MNNPSNTSKLLLLTLVPLVIACLLYSSVSLVIGWRAIEIQKQLTGASLSRNYAALLATGQAFEVELLNIQARRLLEEPAVRSITLYDQDFAQRVHAGPQPFGGTAKSLANEIQLVANDVSTINSDNSTRFFYPIAGRSGVFNSTKTNSTNANSTIDESSGSLAWVEIELDHQPFQIEKYQVFFWIFGLTIVFLLMSSLLAFFAIKKWFPDIISGRGIALVSKNTTSTENSQSSNAGIAPADQQTLKSAPSQNTIVKANVLAVDDNAANLQLLKELLKDLVTDVTTAGNGSEALEQFKRQSFDLIFMDIQMPVLNGIETTQKIRELEKNQSRVPIVALTAHTANEKMTELLAASMDDFLSKPINSNQLHVCLRRWIPALTAAQPIELNNHVVHSNSNSTQQVNDQKKCFESNEVVFGDEKVSKPVDINECLRLSNNRSDLAKDMLTHLTNSLGKDTEEMERAYKHQDFKTLGEIVHRINGGACYCGVPLLQQTSKKLDSLLQQQRYDVIHHPLREMLDASRQLLNWVEQHDIPALFGIENQVTH